MWEKSYIFTAFAFLFITSPSFAQFTLGTCSDGCWSSLTFPQNKGLFTQADKGEDIFSTNLGKIGIGISWPQAKLHVSGDALVSNFDSWGQRKERDIFGNEFIKTYGATSTESKLTLTAYIHDKGLDSGPVITTPNPIPLVFPSLPYPIADTYSTASFQVSVDRGGNTREFSVDVESSMPVLFKSGDSELVRIGSKNDGGMHLYNGDMYLQDGDIRLLDGGISMFGAGSQRVFFSEGNWSIRTNEHNPNKPLVFSQGSGHERVGIGEFNPQSELHVDGTIISDNIISERLTVNASASSTHSLIVNGGILVNASPNPQSELLVDGTITTDILEINGGSDLAEWFNVSVASESHKLVPGALLCIDPFIPGNLVACDRAVDKRVAGVVSGGGGINPGLLMGQRESIANGDVPVSLTGRVYVLADASSGPIIPGDLLTTSSTPGHAMKVHDYLDAQGAIIGKAMSHLDMGKGLVLLLISLQ